MLTFFSYMYFTGAWIRVEAIVGCLMYLINRILTLDFTLISIQNITLILISSDTES
jgi:hypothetical protein